MKAICTDSYNDLLLGIEVLGNNQNMRAIVLGVAPYGEEMPFANVFVVHGTPMELSVLEKYLRMLADAKTERSLLRSQFQVVMREGRTLNFMPLMFNSIRAAIEYGLHRMTRKGGVESRAELIVYIGDYDEIYGVCSLSPDVQVVPGDVLLAYDAWWRTQMGTTLILYLLGVLKHRNSQTYQEVLSRWPELRLSRSRDRAKVIANDPAYANIFFFTVLYDRMQEVSKPGWVFVPTAPGRFGYVRGSQLHKGECQCHWRCS